MPHSLWDGTRNAERERERERQTERDRDIERDRDRDRDSDKERGGTRKAVSPNAATSRSYRSTMSWLVSGLGLRV